jgi:hypothetical protein
MIGAKAAVLAIAGLVGVAAGLIAGSGRGASGAECPVATGDPYALDEVGITALYACLEEAMAAGYRRSGNASALAYRDWTPVQVRPGADPSHDDRLLMTFANAVAAEIYLAFETEGVEMPVGAILAKESIALREGLARPGPLFLMEKIGVEAAPATDGWLYIGFQPNGDAMTFPQAFCHDCHGAFLGQDSLAYPRPELRVGR